MQLLMLLTVSWTSTMTSLRQHSCQTRDGLVLEYLATVS